MCLIIDACCIANVFDVTNKNHGDFSPVYSWVCKGPGKIIYGGNKYKEELKQCKRYLPILVELSRQGRVVLLDDEAVNTEEELVKQRETDPDFDDPHLIAIVIISKCRVICTNDRRAHKFIKKKARKRLTNPTLVMPGQQCIHMF